MIDVTRHKIVPVVFISTLSFHWLYVACYFSILVNTVYHYGLMYPTMHDDNNEVSDTRAKFMLWELVWMSPWTARETMQHK